MAPQQSAEAMFLRAGSHEVPYGGNTGVDQLCSGISYMLPARSSMLMNHQYRVSKVSLDRTALAALSCHPTQVGMPNLAQFHVLGPKHRAHRAARAPRAAPGDGQAHWGRQSHLSGSPPPSALEIHLFCSHCLEGIMLSAGLTLAQGPAGFQLEV